MRTLVTSSLGIILFTSVAGAQTFDQCRHSADRSSNIEAAGARMLELRSPARAPSQSSAKPA